MYLREGQNSKYTPNMMCQDGTDSVVTSTTSSMTMSSTQPVGPTATSDATAGRKRVAMKMVSAIALLLYVVLV